MSRRAQMVSPSWLAVVRLAEAQVGVGPAALLGPPAGGVLAEGAAADGAEAVSFGEVFYGDDDVRHE